MSATGRAEALGEGFGLHVAAALLQLVGHVQDDEGRQAQGEDRRGQDEVPAEVRDVEDEEDRVGLRDARHPPHQDVVRDLLVLRARREAVDAREVDDVELGRVLDLQLAEVLLDRDAGEVRDLLAQARETVEERRLAGVGRADDRHDPRPGQARGGRAIAREGREGVRIAHDAARGVLPRGRTEVEAGGGLASQGDLRTVDAVDARSTSRGPERGRDAASGEEPELHEALGDVRGEVDPVEDRLLSLPEIEECGGVSCVRHVQGRRELKPDLSHAGRMLSPPRHVKARGGGMIGTVRGSSAEGAALGRTGPAGEGTCVAGPFAWPRDARMAYFAAAGAAGAAAPLPMSRSSTSKMSVAPGLIFGGEPASP